MKENYTTNTGANESNPLENAGPIVFNMDQLAQTPVQPPAEAPVEVPTPISTELQPENPAAAEEVPSEAQSEIQTESGTEAQTIDLDAEAKQPEAESAPTQEAASQTIESGPLLKTGYERLADFSEKVKGAKGKLAAFGGRLLRGAGKIIKGTGKILKAGAAALVSPDVLLKRGLKSVKDFAVGVKNLAVDKSTESYTYARDSFLEAWGGLKEKGNGIVEGAKNRVDTLWKGMIAMKTERAIRALTERHQKAATQEDVARREKEALAEQIALKVKLLEDLKSVPKKAEVDSHPELALAA